MENFASWPSRNKKFGLYISFQFGEMSKLGCQPGIKNAVSVFHFRDQILTEGIYFVYVHNTLFCWENKLEEQKLFCRYKKQRVSIPAQYLYFVGKISPRNRNSSVGT